MPGFCVEYLWYPTHCHWFEVQILCYILDQSIPDMYSFVVLLLHLICMLHLSGGKLAPIDF